jgi:DedD protein
MQSPASIMVQIAAVSRQQDANVLISALRQHGFSASAHTEPADHFLHVQVGPFTTRAQAVAMRTKLLSDGYNAILK